MNPIIIWGLVWALGLMATVSAMVSGIAFAISGGAQDKWMKPIGIGALFLHTMGIVGLVIVAKDLL